MIIPYCGKKHKKNKNKCPTLKKLCLNCKKKDNFQVVCKYYRIKERVEGTDPPTENVEIYAIITPTNTREKIMLNGIFFHVQVDTESNVTLILRNFCEKMGKPKLS